MKALEIIRGLREEKRPAPNWTNTSGIYQDCSGYPDVEFYARCPKCGLVHGSYKTMREAHAYRLCNRCQVDNINKLKKQVRELDLPKNRGKPGKSLSRMFNEANRLLPAPLLEGFAWHPELFEHRARLLQALAAAGLVFGQDFSSVDLLHDEFGLEVCGIAFEKTALFIVNRVMPAAVPDLSVRFHFIRDRRQEHGWTAVAVRDDEGLGADTLKQKMRSRVPVMAMAMAEAGLPPEGFDAREYFLSTPGPWFEVAMRELGNEEHANFHLGRDNLDAEEDCDSVNVEGDNATEWTIFRDEDKAEAEALRQVTQDLESEPEIFNQNWLEAYINMESLKDTLSEEARNIEWLREEDDERKVRYLIDHGSLQEEDWYDADGNFVGITPDNEGLVEDALDTFAEEQAKRFDPMEWLRSIYGKEDEVIKEAIRLAGIDVAAAAQDAVNTDGWIHFLNSYSSNYTLLDSGAVAFMTG